jgi:GAF domain-containing protein
MPESRGGHVCYSRDFMLNERSLRAWVYDSASDIARLEVGAAGVARKTADARLLLDRQGFLVGVDLGGAAVSRTLVMLGPHEAVERTVGARVVAIYDVKGELAGVDVHDARKAIRGTEKNPYA